MAAPESSYWEGITAMALKQRRKGLRKYGMALEDNPMTMVQRIEYLQEELIDALMYCEHLKAKICRIEAPEGNFGGE